MPFPDFRIASTMEKLDCSVLSAPTAACGESDARRRQALAAYRVVALRHDGKAVVRADRSYDATGAQLPC